MKNALAARWERIVSSDIAWSFFNSPGAMIAAAVTVLCILATFAAPLIAPYNPFDPAQISLWDGKLPPAWIEGGQAKYVLGTDDQGRDLLSAIIYGLRVSLFVGLTAVILAMVLGVSLGLLHGSQPDAIVVCHDAQRTHIDGKPDYPLPSLNECIALNLQLARRINPAARCAGISVNTSSMSEAQRRDYLDRLSAELELPCADPIATGIEPIVQGLLA